MIINTSSLTVDITKTCHLEFGVSIIVLEFIFVKESLLHLRPQVVDLLQQQPNRNKDEDRLHLLSTLHDSNCTRFYLSTKDDSI